MKICPHSLPGTGQCHGRDFPESLSQHHSTYACHNVTARDHLFTCKDERIGKGSVGGEPNRNDEAHKNGTGPREANLKEKHPPLPSLLQHARV